MTSYYTVRISDEYDAPRELDRLIRFYKENAAAGNRVRDPLQLLKSIGDRQAYFLEDSHDAIIGIALCFAHNTPLRNANRDAPLYTEAGGTRIIKNGFGLQRVLHMCRTVNEYFFRPPEECYFSVIAAWNKRSIDNTTSLGFTRWSPNREFFRVIGLPDDYSQNEKLFFKLDVRVLAEHARQLVDLYECPVLTNRYTSETVRLNFEIPLLKMQETRQILKRIAQGRIPIPFI